MDYDTLHALYLLERRRRQEEQRRRQEEQRRREAAESRIRSTTLMEFLDACHNHLHSNLTVQSNATLSTRGNPANAKNKLRPNKLVAWEDFPAQQAAIWDNIMDSNLPSQRRFTSLHTLEESSRTIQQRRMSSELDLHHFQRSTVEDHVSSIVEQLYNEPGLRRKFRLRGTVEFENHANTLSPESQLEDGESTSATRAGTTRPPCRADQICVYNVNTGNTENRVAAFVIEYKAPHKLPLGYIYEGLEDMDLDDVVRARDPDPPRDKYRRLIAAIITQAFSYMIESGLEYGCVCTGEASIFLWVPTDEPGTVHYYLSVPKGDVGALTGWSPNTEGVNRLHLTALGQMLAFTLQALKSPVPHSQVWRTDAAAQLKSWKIVYEKLLATVPRGDRPSSDYRPPRQDGFLRMSPIQLRRRATPTGSPSCWSPADEYRSSDEDSDQHTPSRRPGTRSLARTQPHPRAESSRTASRQGAQSAEYCTQQCLLGLVNGGALDALCPNVRGHGSGYHQIDLSRFLTLIYQQLSEDLDIDCNPVGRPGACGVLFRVRLRSHGYTVAAKATPAHFVSRLQWEASIYNQLRPLQGVHIPVHLGNVDLKTHYFYEGITKLVHMMFLSFGGMRISKHLTSQNSTVVAQEMDYAARAIHNLGVLHKDLEPRNILWNEERSQVMVIDFERAEIVEAPSAMGVISANQERTWPSDASKGKRGKKTSVFARERRHAFRELQALTHFRDPKLYIQQT